MIQKNRLIVTGPPSSGKTSAILSLSDIAPTSSNIYQNAPHLAPPDAQPVMLDYGELKFNHNTLELYATPGQRRFQFMWRTLSKKAMGLLIILDHRRPNPIADIEMYLDNFSTLIPYHSMIIGLNHFNVKGGPDISEYKRAFANRDCTIPIVPIDPRNKQDMNNILYLLTLSVILHSTDQS